MHPIYDEHYYDKFRKDNLIYKLFIQYIDRKEPVFRIIKKLKAHGSTLLDVGCGNGLFLSHAQKYFECTGIDLSDAGLERAKKFASKSKIFKLSADSLQMRFKKKFDVVSCFDVLEHCDNPQLVMRQIWSVLKNDGLSIFSFPNTDCFSLRTKLNTAFCFKDDTHQWFYSPDQWEFLLQCNGLIPVRRWYSGLSDPPYTSLIPLSLQNIFFKYTTQLLSIIGFPIPKLIGEGAFIMCLKNSRRNFT